MAKLPMLRSLKLLVLATPWLPSAKADSVCHGFDEEWRDCGNEACASNCVPVNCAFGRWGEWYSGGGCTGLMIRERNIQTSNNECGTPCDGPKIETRSIAGTAEFNASCVNEPESCKFGEWSTWSSCGTGLQRTRVRQVSRDNPKFGGTACAGIAKETVPCEVENTAAPCEFSQWHEWTACSATCGPGVRSHHRRIEKYAEEGGSACDGLMYETEGCTVAACPVVNCKLSEWTPWAPCKGANRNHDGLQQCRSRSIRVQPSGGGLACDENLSEMNETVLVAQACKLSEWSSWAGCDKDCGGGQTTRSRTLLAEASHGGKCDQADLKETHACNTHPCESDIKDCVLEEWGAWSTCSASCGGGHRKRSRDFVAATTFGRGCDATLEETEGCSNPDIAACGPRDCEWGDWLDWSGCSCSCGGGTKKRGRVVAQTPLHHGKPCDVVNKFEVAPCSTDPCPTSCVDGQWAQWEDWSPCSTTCETGFQTRSRNVLQHPDECGAPLAGEYQEFKQCTVPAACEPPADCELSMWGDWSFCSTSCFGVRERNRFISSYATGNGRPCLGDSLRQVQPCHPGPLEPVPEACGTPPENCTLSPWSRWSDCDKTCGGGQQYKARRVLTEPKQGGAPCDEVLKVTRPCNENPCTVTTCTDCVWGEWSEWSACSKCGGERYRHRDVLELPNHCGKMCDMQAAKEVSDCPVLPECDESYSCTWTSWSAASGCSTGCGAGSGTRNRQLSLTKGRPAPGVLPFILGNSSLKCAGSQEELQECMRPDCGNKAPVDCVFGEWQEWSAPTCQGLCERSRVIATINNEWGKVCDGPLTITKRCNATCQGPVDCKFGEWMDWSKCESSHGQKYRLRTIDTPAANGGVECKGSLNETAGCLKIEAADCEVAQWSAWDPCPVPCGGAIHKRYRQITQHAATGGALCSDSLEQVKMCNEQACPTQSQTCVVSDWGDWSMCDENEQQYRERSITTAALGDGARCNESLHETASCGGELVNCEVSEWTLWGECDSTCGGGQRERTRQVQRFPEEGGKPCPSSLVETEPCNTQPCTQSDCTFDQWTQWSACSSKCGAGQQTRQRAILSFRDLLGTGCQDPIQEMKPCKSTVDCGIVDCAWGDWSEWSGCSCSCDGGQKTRHRSIASFPRLGGKVCQPGDMEQITSCNTQPCANETLQDGQWGPWTAWSPCSATCESGTKFRTRKIAKMPQAGGAGPYGKDREVVPCNEAVPCVAAVDCLFRAWGEWSGCSEKCDGVRVRSRGIERYGRGLGKWCLGALKETWPCNPSVGEALPDACKGPPKVNCTWSEWSAWTQCSAPCGGGYQKQTRFVKVPASGGGEGCKGESERLQTCGDGPCTDPRKTDCVFGEWQEWGACSKCGGQKKRFRSHIQYATHGGKNCDEFAMEDTADCLSECEQKEQLYCTFADWEDWSQCTSTCGPGVKSRRRNLFQSKVLAKRPPTMPTTTSTTTTTTEEEEDETEKKKADADTAEDELEEDYDGSWDVEDSSTRHQSVQGLLLAFACGFGFVLAAFFACRVWGAAGRSAQVRPEGSYSPLRPGRADAGAVP